MEDAHIAVVDMNSVVRATQYVSATLMPTSDNHMIASDGGQSCTMNSITTSVKAVDDDSSDTTTVSALTIDSDINAAPGVRPLSLGTVLDQPMALFGVFDGHGGN